MEGKSWLQDWAEGKLSCDAGPALAWADPIRNCGVRIALQSCPELDGDGLAAASISLCMWAAQRRGDFG